MRLEELNALNPDAAVHELLRCCGSTRWAQEMAALRPFASAEALRQAADGCCDGLNRVDWLEAFAAHPKIGAGTAVGVRGAARAGPAPRSAPPSRRRRFGEPRRTSHAPSASGGGKAFAERGSDTAWPEQEQAGVADAAAATLQRLADANRDYEARFGYIFIVCATGKTAADMLEMLERRLGNDPTAEVRVAAGEQQKITRLRLMKLVDSGDRT